MLDAMRGEDSGIVFKFSRKKANVDSNVSKKRTLENLVRNHNMNQFDNLTGCLYYV